MDFKGGLDKKLGHWGVVFEGNAGISVFSSFFLFVP